ncbi:MAG TPA: HEAT repeat domain-containing protein [Pirellulales bacterium]
MRRRLPLAMLVLGCLAPAVLHADTFVLKSGGKVEGTLVNPQETPREKYVIKLDAGGEITLARDQVKDVQRKRPAEVEYDKIRATYPDTAAGQWALAEWCREQHLAEARKVHLKRVIELDSDHAAARGALGYGRFDGQWKTQPEVMTERGYVEYKGRWRLPQEVEILEQLRKSELAEKTWYTNLKRWRDWLNGDRRDEATKCILEIRDPSAVAAVKRQLDNETEQSVRLLLVSALANIGSPAAVHMLAALSLEDANSEVRLTCVDHLDDAPSPEIVAFYIQKLRDKDNTIVNRAAIGLARMKDPSAIPPLVDALVTTHKFKVVSGQAQGNYSASFGSGGAGFGTGGGGPKIITQQLHNPAVLEALVLLTPNINFNYDVAAWKRWLATQRHSKMLDARRG